MQQIKDTKVLSEISDFFTDGESPLIDHTSHKLH